jgi:hypothetical protein
MSDSDTTELEALRAQRQDALDTERAIEPLVSGPEHALLAKRIATDLRDLELAASELAELVNSWQFLAGMCGLFDDLDESERPAPDWRARIEQALALIDEATA